MNSTEFIAEKYAAGATITETIKAVLSEYGMSLEDAKILVSSHPCWAKVVEAARPLQSDIDSLKIKRPKDNH